MVAWSLVSTIHTVLLETPHGCRVTFSPGTPSSHADAQAGSWPSGAYSISNATVSRTRRPALDLTARTRMFAPPATHP